MYLLLLDVEPRPKVAGGFGVPSASEHELGLWWPMGSVIPSDSDRAQSRPSGDKLLWSTISSLNPLDPRLFFPLVISIKHC